MAAVKVPMVYKTALRTDSKSGKCHFFALNTFQIIDLGTPSIPIFERSWFSEKYSGIPAFHGEILAVCKVEADKSPNGLVCRVEVANLHFPRCDLLIWKIKFCRNCNRDTHAFTPKSEPANHHAIISLCTLGLWIPFWLVLTADVFSTYRCPDCGKKI